jgi:hypothetical protein
LLCDLTMVILRLMDDIPPKGQNTPTQKITLSENSLKIANPPKFSRTKLFYLIDAILIVGVVIMLFRDFGTSAQPNKPVAKLKSTSSSGVPGSEILNTSNTTPSATNNPLNNNGSINSQVKYCTNAINAEYVC